MRGPRGLGSVFYRKQDDRWAAVISVHVPRGERRRRVVRYAKSREAAEEALAALRAEYGLPNEPRPVRTRQEWLEAARLLGRHTRREWYAKIRAAECRCYYCGVKGTLRQGIGKDHMVPLTRGGSDAIDNVVPACRRCNSEKSALTAEEFLTDEQRRERWKQREEAEASRRRVGLPSK